MTKNLFIMSVSLFSFCSFAVDSYSIYLVRHAEKLTDLKNPALTTCGTTRAEQLANMLSKTAITSIYSTSYQRTMQTAKPLATQQSITIKTYNPKQLEQFSLQLKHSNRCRP